VAIKNNQKGVPVIVEVANQVKNLNGVETDRVVSPFSHPRLLAHDFVLAEKVIQHVLRTLHKTKWITPAPRIIFQPMEKLEGGVTHIEERFYRERCLNAGAREILAHIGEVLSVDTLNFNEFKRKNSKEALNTSE